LTLLISQKPIGCSTTYARAAGMIEKWLRGPQVEAKPYYQEFKPVVDWQWMLVVGVVVGSFISAQLSGDFGWQWIPTRWTMAFGVARLPRVLVAMLGGVLLGFGARWADGCTSGHGISGTMQLSIASWVSAICFFLSGILMARFLFGVLA